jgi:LmbE family N-acetylglucosaminyl deacetylase
MNRTFLFIFAHPDDESFAGAGTAMKYAAAGARTVLVTATLGERGKRGDPPVCAADQLPACRECELREAAAIIGIDELHLLGYVDRELHQAPPDEIRRTLVRLIRREKPAIVFTFDPNGLNRHPDHIAINRFTTDAVLAAADPRWHLDSGERYTVPRLLWTPPITPWDAASVERIEQQPGVDFVIDVSPWLERRAHRTQHLSIDRCFFNKPDVDRILATEIWRQAWGPPLGKRPAGDIFEGL